MPQTTPTGGDFSSSCTRPPNRIFFGPDLLNFLSLAISPWGRNGGVGLSRTGHLFLTQICHLKSPFPKIPMLVGWWVFHQPNLKHMLPSNWIMISPRFGLNIKNIWVATTQIDSQILQIPGEDRCFFLNPKRRASGDVWGFKHWSSQGIWMSSGNVEFEKRNNKRHKRNKFHFFFFTSNDVKPSLHFSGLPPFSRDLYIPPGFAAGKLKRGTWKIDRFPKGIYPFPCRPIFRCKDVSLVSGGCTLCVFFHILNHSS